MANKILRAIEKTTIGALGALLTRWFQFLDSRQKAVAPHAQAEDLVREWFGSGSASADMSSLPPALRERLEHQGERDQIALSIAKLLDEDQVGAKDHAPLFALLEHMNGAGQRAQFSLNGKTIYGTEEYYSRRDLFHEMDIGGSKFQRGQRDRMSPGLVEALELELRPGNLRRHGEFVFLPMEEIQSKGGEAQAEEDGLRGLRYNIIRCGFQPGALPLRMLRALMMEGRSPAARVRAEKDWPEAMSAIEALELREDLGQSLPEHSRPSRPKRV